MTAWTKKSVAAAYTHELIEWNNKIVPDLEKAKQLGVTLKNSERIIKLITAELKKRRAI